jgi:hypothetical protein
VVGIRWKKVEHDGASLLDTEGVTLKDELAFGVDEVVEDSRVTERLAKQKREAVAGEVDYEGIWNKVGNQAENFFAIPFTESTPKAKK